MDNQRNLILAVVLSALILFGWPKAVELVYPHAAKPVAQQTAAPDGATPSPAATAKPTREGGLERDFALLCAELLAALARAAEGKGDPPRKKPGPKR